MRRFPRKSARDSFNTQHFLRHTPTLLTPGVVRTLAFGLQEPPGTPHPLGAASPPPTRRRTGCPTHPLCLALSASPRRLLSLGAITCDFLVTDAVRFPGPDEAGSWGVPLPPSSPCLAAFLCLSTPKWLLKQQAAWSSCNISDGLLPPF